MRETVNKRNKLPAFLTAEETAELLRIPVTSVWRLCRQGKLPVVPKVRPYRIIRDQLLEVAQ